ncbi:hypothetical protein SAMN04488109_2703 [Chryseolinea serpens]|uniref:Uncharacterized protein n=1 Tax=Chryseolinea serpens TaxID=947013 RepID=A0A1M5P6E7_9BACT|nr:hypothetical protein SAMN04488109_2703 [Chryseolinea serpens]
MLLPAGIVSLSLLSFLCIEFIHQQLVRKNWLRALELVTWNPRGDEITPDPAMEDKFMKIRLTGAVDDADKLRFVKQTIHQRLQENDTTTGFELTFGDHVKYGTFVQLASLCKAEDVQSVFFRNGKFRIYNVHPRPGRHRLFYDYEPYLRPEDKLFNFKRILSTRFTWCLALLFLFVMLIVAATRKIIKLV